MILGQNIVKKIIEKQIRNGEPPLISDINFNSNTQKNNPAKVELSLGKFCYISSDTRTIVELEDGGFISIPPNQILLYQSKELLSLPGNIAGRISLKMKHTANGLLMSNQTQIDPGYKNYVFGMMYNLSDQEIKLNYGQDIVSLELFEVKDSGAVYNGHMNQTTFKEFVSNRIKSSLGQLEKDLHYSLEKFEKTRNYFKCSIYWLTIILTLLTLTVGIVALKPNSEISKLQYEIDTQKEQIELFKKEIERFRESNKNYQLNSKEQLQLMIENAILKLPKQPDQTNENEADLVPAVKQHKEPANSTN